MTKTEFVGSLRERIRILRPLSQRDVLGSASDQTEEIGEFWAAVEAAGTGEERQAESRASLSRWRFTLRETQGILPGDHLIWGERSMTIRNVSLDYRMIPKTILLAEESR